MFDTGVRNGTDLFVDQALPWMGKKAVEMGRYYGSEALRNKKLQKNTIDYALDKLNPVIHNVGSQALDQLSTKIRPKKNYKTNRKDLDGSGLIDSALTAGVFGYPFHVDYKKGLELLTAPDLFKAPNKHEITYMKERVKYYKEQYKKAKADGYKGSYTRYAKKMGWVEKLSFTFPGFGGAIDIHKQIGKLPRPVSGWTLPGHK